MRQKIIFQFLAIAILLAVIITSLSLYNLRNTGIKSVIHNAESISQAVKNGLTTHMINNNMDQIDTYLNLVSNMNNVEKLWLVRGELVAKQFGNGTKNESPRDDMDRSVLLSGEMKYKIDESLVNTSIRITIPYIATAGVGMDCLQCHDVSYGDTLGAVSLVLDVSELKEIGLESIYLIAIAIVFGIILIVYLGRRILKPYIILFENLGKSISDAVSGKFKNISYTPGLTKDMVSLADEYNTLMSIFRDTSEDIEKKLKGFVGHRQSGYSSNPLEESKDIIANLSNLYQFKKEIELDSTKEEIYNRLSQVFTNQFKIKHFTFLEIDMLKQKMTEVLKVGDSFHCRAGIIDTPHLCRAARTKNDVTSIDYHSSCSHFKKENKFYHCINVDISKNAYLIINFVCDSKDELEKLKDNISFIKSYINESAPSIEVKLLMNALKESAFKDGLTGLYNRKFLEEHSKKLVPQALRENLNIGVLMLDMDHFKAVNDEYGHDIGDKVLKELSRILMETVRESDLVIRYGGEEFIVLLVGVKNEFDAMEVANKIGKKVRENEIDVYAGNKLRKTISIGLSMFPEDSKSLDTAMKNADIALYEAKNSGRDKVIRFNEEQVSSVDLF
ncbi:MAG: GGDEF domain-containing protein [Poseidonibacter sp.]|uniref:GGDEF domain-containing protein n=1 Tax=Poseidonibacter sp. TaxID=2321188 RepID=UPI00359CD276